MFFDAQTELRKVAEDPYFGTGAVSRRKGRFWKAEFGYGSGLSCHC